MRQHRCRSAVLQHISDPFCRISWVQRYITAARLENRQQADDHLHAAFNTYPDPRIRLHAPLAQGMGQTVGLLVKLAIRQALFAVDDCKRLRRTLDLRFKQAMDGLLLRVIQRGVVEIHQQLLALVGRQDRQAVQRCLRRLLQCLDQAFQRRLHIPANPLGTDTGDSLNSQAESFAKIVEG